MVFYYLICPCIFSWYVDHSLIYSISINTIKSTFCDLNLILTILKTILKLLLICYYSTHNLHAYFITKISVYISKNFSYSSKYLTSIPDVTIFFSEWGNQKKSDHL